MAQGRSPEALAEAGLVTRLGPASATAWEAKGDALAAMGRGAEARVAYTTALKAPELDPVFQQDLVRALRQRSGT
jgi:Flp pilus assembly protein TadD